jgi:hypothetical protein
VFTENDPFAGIDLDKCRDPESGQIDRSAREIIDRLKSYAEISPSNTGVKIFIKGRVGAGKKRGRIEVYAKGRYFTVTGGRLGPTATIEERQTEIDAFLRQIDAEQPRTKQNPKENESPERTANMDDASLVDKMLAAKNGQQILRLMNGEWEGGNLPTQSEADEALCCHIAFYSQDPEQIDRIFRGSKLYREKWDKKHYGDGRTYGQATVQRALEGVTEKYQPKGSAPVMADLRMFLDMAIDPGQPFTSEAVCKGLGAYSREHKKQVYMGLSRLVQDGVIKKDQYKHGGFRKPLLIVPYDLGGAIEVNELIDIKLPLDLHNLMRIGRNHLVCIAGRYDAGKSSFLYHVMQLNYRSRRVVHFASDEWDLSAIQQRLDELHIERPHPHVSCYPMQEGYEDLIPPEPCIVLVDYIRTQTDPRDIDRQFYRILQNLKGGVAFAAIQKHPGLDRPTGGQFAVHAPHHVLLLDKLKDGNAFVCKIFKTKSEKDLEGLFRVFGFKEGRCLVPYMKDWKKGEIKWTNTQDNKDNDDNQDNKK